MLTTSRLKIRLLIADDWREMQKIAEDFARSPYILYDMPLPTDEEKIRELTAKFAESGLFFAVFKDGEMIGYVCFHEDNGIFDLGYCFRSDFHGKGYAFESCEAVMKHISATHKVKYFTAGTALKNEPSCKLLQKLGFKLESTEKLAFHKDGNGNPITFEGGNFKKSK